jgi:hypothetical protein
MKTGDGVQHGAGGKGEGASHEEAPFSFPLENEGHERFCQEIVNRRSQARAYLLAYPDCSPDSAGASSTRLLRDDKVRGRIEFLKQEFRGRFRMTQDEIILGLEMAAQLDPDLLFDHEGNLLPLTDLPAEVRLCIERIEYEDITVGEGNNKKKIGRTGKIHVMSKKAAYEMLTKIHGMQRERKEVTHKFTLEELLAASNEELVHE